jgi:DNA recombination-dependent growth factor C
MGLVKGSAALCRYRVLEEPQTGRLTTEQVQGRLRRDAFIDIEDAPEESSVGWVEILDCLSSEFAVGSFEFGDFLAFGLRLDERKLAAKTLNRYLMIAESRLAKESGKKLNSLKRNQLKESLRIDLLKRSLLTTNLWQAVWLTDRDEVWVDASTERARVLFEDQWARTFGLALRLLVPISLGLELLPDKLQDKLIRIEPVNIWE